MTPAPVPVPKTPPAKGSLGKWVAGHKWEAGLGVGGIGVTLYLAYRARKNAAASGTSSTATTAPANSSALPLSYYPPMTGGDGSSFDAGQFGGVLSQLSEELNTLAGQSSSTSSSSTPNYSSETLQGSGYLPGSAPYGEVTALSGTAYAYLPNAAAVQAAVAGGTPTFYQPAPGVFEPLAAGTQGAPGTPTYIQA